MSSSNSTRPSWRLALALLTASVACQGSTVPGSAVADASADTGSGAGDATLTGDVGSIGDAVPMEGVSGEDVVEDTAASIDVEAQTEDAPAPSDVEDRDVASTPDACASACDGATCGPDGCGGSCGDCTDGLTCVGGGCVGDPVTVAIRYVGLRVNFPDFTPFVPTPTVRSDVVCSSEPALLAGETTSAGTGSCEFKLDGTTCSLRARWDPSSDEAPSLGPWSTTVSEAPYGIEGARCGFPDQPSVRTATYTRNELQRSFIFECSGELQSFSGEGASDGTDGYCQMVFQDGQCQIRALWNDSYNSYDALDTAWSSDLSVVWLFTMLPTKQPISCELSE